VWKWDSDPFGTDVPNQNPSGLGTFVYNLRFPGQYYDQETGLNYNYYRDYDSATGRYISSDPIGLAGGINTYGYANQNPVSNIDPFGLASCIYSISTHSLSCTPNAGGDPSTLGPKGVWSGVGPCANDPNCVGHSDIGPIVPGNYDMNKDDRPGHNVMGSCFGCLVIE